MDSPRPHTAGAGFAGPRRVFTSPVTTSAPPSAGSPQSSDGLVDTLYAHPNVKIVAFTAGARPFSISPRPAEVEPGTLQWWSPLERTIAVGPFRIYRAPNSVAFLSCGSALQPILPKSQVWCVDVESSKFILQIRRPQYWRIELPIGTEEEVNLAQHLRQVFDAILLFEKTECPFQRPFTVELPERPQTPVKKRPWTPARRSSASLPLTPSTPVEIARLHEGTPRGSICLGDLRSARESRRALTEHAITEEPPLTQNGPATADNTPSMSRVERAKRVFGAQPTLSPAAIVRSRSAEPRREPRSASTASVTSPTESVESLRGRESWLTVPLPPSPPLSSPGSPVIWSPLPPSQARQTTASLEAAFDHTVTTKPSRTWSVITTDSNVDSECSAVSTAPSSVPEPTCPRTDEQDCDPETTDPESSTSTLEAEPESQTDSPAAASSSDATAIPRRRPTRRSTLSSSSSMSSADRNSLPPPSELLTGSPQRNPPASGSHSATPARRHRRRATSVTIPGGTAAGPNPVAAAVRRLPLSVFVKTCEILFSPPTHLISLMLNVAARIAAGEWRGLVWGMGEGGERINVEWDWSEEEDAVHSSFRSGEAGWRWGEGKDSNARRAAHRRRRMDVKGSDEIWFRSRRGVRMAGAFPESSDEEEDCEDSGTDNDSSGAEEEPVSPGRKERSASSSSKTRKRSPTNGSAASPKSGGTDGWPTSRRRAAVDAEPEWGID
ncbi:hypothetical protein VTJ04DRAFT_10755 [Mycothermus thermophilus]|uniref:uncharacterized protein n=1 Tax=Humicola insolens TaxID=85995 RepID=UPI0037427CB6